MPDTNGRPNVLWLMTDEQRADSLGCYGSEWARTPTLDELAQEGTIFETAVTPSPVCVPARVSLLSGRRPHENDVLANTHHGNDWQPLTHVFDDNGYDTATFGKQHYYRDDVFETSVGNVITDAVHYFHYGDGYDAKEYQAVQYPSEVYPWLFAGRYPESAETRAEAQVVDSAIEWLKGRDGSDPFFLRLSFNAPHTPVVPPAPYDELIAPDEIQVPGAFMEPAERRPKWQSEFLDEYQSSNRLTEDQLRRAQQCYYGLCSFADAQFGRLLDWMSQRELLSNTIVAFIADHGTHLGDHGMMQKQTFYEPVATVPFFITAPGCTGQRVQTPVETRSLLPTVLDLCGLSVPEDVQDVSLADTITGGRKPDTKPVFSQISQETWGYRPIHRLVMVTDGRWKLSLFYDERQTDPFSRWADGELYDLQTDPLERNNLLHDRRHRRRVRQLFAKIRQHV